MPAKAVLQTPRQLETLLSFVMRRQRESSAVEDWETYQRLGDAALAATDGDLRTVTLAWLETELSSIRRRNDDLSRSAPQLLDAALALFTALDR